MATVKVSASVCFENDPAGCEERCPSCPVFVFVFFVLVFFVFVFVNNPAGCVEGHVPVLNRIHNMSNSHWQCLPSSLVVGIYTFMHRMALSNGHPFLGL